MLAMRLWGEQAWDVRRAFYHLGTFCAHLSLGDVNKKA